MLNNTVFLYIMAFSTQLLNLVTIPYLTRVLGPTVYGKIGLAVGYMTYVQLILDFGFLLSATREVAEHKTDKAYLLSLMASVTLIKLALAALAGVGFLLLGLGGFIDVADIGFYLVYLLAYVFNALLPDYFYRGIEDMKTISIRTVAIRSIFAAMVFLFVKSDADYFFVPVSLLAGNVVALGISLADVRKRCGAFVHKPSRMAVRTMFKKSFPFFISRITATFYQALNVLILGKLYGASPVLGYYTSGDKVISLAKTGSSPIADSLYPYMIRHRDFKLIKKLLIVAMPPITVAVVLIAIYAEPLCVLLFGGEYAAAGTMLRLLLPIAWVILPSYIIAFPVLSPMGLSKYANMSNVFGMCIQLCGLAVLHFAAALNVFTLCALTSVTEVSVFLFRLVTILLNRNKLRAAPASEVEAPAPVAPLNL